ncbi:MAG: minor capsid protein [Sporomusaceae bacterium]|jgi:SPP1 gp7 family putative phage head morphogenesis protein|nr:minor capsid protein [Sporomusaceae bacterium]
MKIIDESKMLQRLDDIDLSSVRQYEKYLEKLTLSAEKTISRSNLTAKEVFIMPYPLPGELGNILTKHALEALAAGQAHARILTDEQHTTFERKNKLAAPISVDPANFWITPTAAIDALEVRENMLANDVEGELWRDVKKTLLEHLQGATRKETITALALLPKVNLRRAELIITTEGTYAYNRGRLKGYQEAQVDYVRFSAVMDMRTSDQCRSRHGKIIAMNSPDLANNTPPLHGRCRSLLSPLFSEYYPEYFTEEALDWSKTAPLPKGWRPG